MLNACVLTALPHVGLPVLQALADELVHARFAPDAADLLRRADAASRALRLPPGASCRTTHDTEYDHQGAASVKGQAWVFSAKTAQQAAPQSVKACLIPHRLGS